MSKSKIQNNLKIKNPKLNFLYSFFMLGICFVICILSFVICGISYASGLKSAQELFLREDYEAVIRASPKAVKASQSRVEQAEIYYIWAQSYVKLNNFTQAEEVFTKMLKECQALSVCTKAVLGLGDVYFALENYAKAKELYNEAALAGGDFTAQAYYRLSRVNFKLGDTAGGREYMELLKQKYPLSFEAQSVDELGPAQNDLLFTVQVGAFSQEDNAVKLAADLKKNGFDAFVEPAGENDAALYRVRVGRFKTREVAERTAEALTEQGHPTKIFP